MSVDQVPPHDPEAEAALLGAFLLDRDRVAELAPTLRPEDFYLASNRLVFEAITALNARDAAIDAVTVKDELRRLGTFNQAEGAETLVRVMESVPSATGAAHHAGIIQDLARRRTLRAALLRELKNIHRQDVETGSVVEALQATISRIGASAGPALPWRTYQEILAATEGRPREWLVPDLIPFNAVTALVGQAKKAGKSTFAWALVAAAERGLPFLGVTLPRTQAVILSEEGDHDVADKIRSFRLDLSSGAVLSRGVIRGVPEWAAVVRDATERALRLGARILLIDTFAFWAALEGDSENAAGIIIAAMRPPQAAADAGLAVLVNHHVGKAEGREGGHASRGSTAFAGAVEAILEVRYVGTEDRPNRRLLHLESRAVGVRDLVVEMIATEEGTDSPARFELVGEAAEVGREDVALAVERFLAENPGWHTSNSIVEGVSRRGGEVRKALAALPKSARIARIGRGRTGDPYRYAPAGTPPPAPDSAPGNVIVPAVPDCSPSVPGKGLQDPPATVPAVPPLLQKGGTGTVRGSQGMTTAHDSRQSAAGNGGGALVAAPAQAHVEPSAGDNGRSSPSAPGTPTPRASDEAERASSSQASTGPGPPGGTRDNGLQKVLDMFDGELVDGSEEGLDD